MAVKVKATIGIVAMLLLGAILVSVAGGRRTSSPAAFPVHGSVTDRAGAPIAGATVTVDLPKGTVSRFTDSAGLFAFPSLPAGEYEVIATAFGYNTDSYTGPIDAEGGVGMVLNEQWNPDKLTTADWMTTTTHDQSLLLELECMSCHTLHTVANSRGLTADHWGQLIKKMGTRFVIPKYTDARLAHVTAALEGLYGPKAPLPTREQVRRPAFNAKVAEATVWEWKIPTDSFSHSMTVAPEQDVALFTEFDDVANAIGIFDLKTETFTERKLETPKTGPHTPVVGKDGRIYIAHAGKDAIGIYDPKTGELRDVPVPPGAGGSIPTVDPDGNIWWGASGLTSIAKLDPKTEKVELFKVPTPEKPLPGSWSHVAHKTGGDPKWGPFTGLPATNPVFYGFAADSQGKIWWGEHNQGAIGSFNPKTGAFQRLEIPGGTSNPRGIAVDANDVVWFSTYVLHKLGKYDQKTGEMKLYQPPTEHASPYGLLVSRYTGHVWFADPIGSHLTRFDPATEEFVEYPIPTLDGYARFMGEDSQGRICFTEFMASKIGCLAPTASAASAAAGATQ